MGAELGGGLGGGWGGEGEFLWGVVGVGCGCGRIVVVLVGVCDVVVVEAVWVVGVGRGVGGGCCCGLLLVIQLYIFLVKLESSLSKLTFGTLVMVVLVVELAHAVDGVSVCVSVVLGGFCFCLLLPS